MIDSTQPLGWQKFEPSPDCVFDIPKSFSSKSSTRDRGTNSKLTGELESMVIGIDDRREEASPCIHLATRDPKTMQKGIKVDINPKEILLERPNSEETKFCYELYSSNARSLTATHGNGVRVNTDLDSSHDTESDIYGDSSVDRGSNSSSEYKSQFNDITLSSDTFPTDESGSNGCCSESFQQVNDDPESPSCKTGPTSSKRSQTYSQSDSPSSEVLKYEGFSLSSLLRSFNFEDQAEFVDDVGKEITGTASDVALAFSQILNAFRIDDEAIDSISHDIYSATVDLSKTSFTR